jgi:CHASE3 domain sensor protein
MSFRIRKRLTGLGRGSSLRRRVAYSLALVRLILVPVIALAIYYLFDMGWIVDRIVSVDAPAASYAERLSIEMLDARREERNYFLLHDPVHLQANRQSLMRLQQILADCHKLQPEEQDTLNRIQYGVKLYQDRLQEAVARLKEPSQEPMARIREVIQEYENGLNEFLKRARHETRSQLTQELQTRVGSLDAEIATTLAAEDPSFRLITEGLQASAREVMQLAAQLEKRSWERVQRDHRQARKLTRRAEWVLSIVSALTLLLSVWVSFVLPREVVKPLADLKAAVDRAQSGDYEIEFDVQGESEVRELANSVRGLIMHVREKKTGSGLSLQT